MVEARQKVVHRIQVNYARQLWQICSLGERKL